jgi:hypothetical protein
MLSKLIKAVRYLLVGALGTVLVMLGRYDGVYAASTNLTWTPPTQNTDGTPLTDLTSYRIYRALAATPAACATATLTVLATVPAPATGYLDANQTQNGTYCYQVTALDAASNESARSNMASKAIDLLAPAGPTNLQAN